MPRTIDGSSGVLLSSKNFCRLLIPARRQPGLELLPGYRVLFRYLYSDLFGKSHKLLSRPSISRENSGYLAVKLPDSPVDHGDARASGKFSYNRKRVSRLSRQSEAQCSPAASSLYCSPVAISVITVVSTAAFIPGNSVPGRLPPFFCSVFFRRERSGG